MTVSSPFHRADAFRRWIEGGYSNDAADRGGETLFGISKRAHPDVDFATLTQESALVWFHDHYWLPIRGDELPWPASFALYDWCVNSGDPEGASYPEREFQTEIGATPDGAIGDATVRLAWDKAHVIGAPVLALNLHLRRSAFVAEIVKGDPSQVRFLKGWMKRLAVVASLLHT